MDIKEFRIVESALNGFYIQRLFKTKKYKWFLFWVIRTEIIEKWQNIGVQGREPIYLSSVRSWMVKPMDSFCNKEDAVKYLEMLCTPDEFHYPDGFNLGLSNNIPDVMEKLTTPSMRSVGNYRSNLCDHIFKPAGPSTGNIGDGFAICSKCGFKP